MAVTPTQMADARALVMRARGLCKRFGGQQVLIDADLDIHAGEVVLLQGENGSGKTTLLNILTGNLEPDSGIVEVHADGAAEHFRFPRHWWQDMNPFDHFTPERLAEEGVGRLWQDVRLFQTQSLVDNIAVAELLQAGESPVDALFAWRGVRAAEQLNRAAAMDLLARLGMKERADATAERISLGQSKRVAILRALRAGARVVFLDEPLAGLDAEGIRTVIDFIISLARERKVAIVMVEHAFNIPRLLPLADRIWTLEEGRLRIQTPDTAVDSPVSDPASRYLDLLRAATGRSARTIVHALPANATLTILRPPQEPMALPVAALTIEGAVIQRGARRVIGWDSDPTGVTGLDLQICSGDIGILQAPNGWGKTTLALALAGIIPLQQGRIAVHGKRVDECPAWRRARSGLLTYLGADRHYLRLKVAEFLCLSLCRSVPPELAPFQLRRMSALSGGERARVALHALGCRPYEIRILDEPFNSLSAAASLAVARQLFTSPASGANLILEPAVHNFSLS
jgi:ABC-type branched-subunit amino acid transport system ATPase component